MHSGTVLPQVKSHWHAYSWRLGAQRSTFGVICSCAFPLELKEAGVCDPVGLSSKALAPWSIRRCSLQLDGPELSCMVGFMWGWEPKQRSCDWQPDMKNALLCASATCCMRRLIKFIACFLPLMSPAGTAFRPSLSCTRRTGVLNLGRARPAPGCPSICSRCWAAACHCRLPRLTVL